MNTQNLRLVHPAPIVTVNGLSKSFGEVKALTNITLEIPEGKIIGLLGPNGSGKTTLIRIMAGLYNSYSGEILIDGMKPGAASKARVAYLPDRPAFSLKKNVGDICEIYENFFSDFNRAKFDSLMGKFDIKQNVPFNEMSKGMIDKIQIGFALARSARLFLLDEPLAGVDVAARENVLDTILENFDSKGTILVATHLISEIERLFDSVLVLNDGRLILSGECDDIRSRYGYRLEDAMRTIFQGGK